VYDFDSRDLKAEIDFACASQKVCLLSIIQKPKMRSSLQRNVVHIILAVDINLERRVTFDVSCSISWCHHHHHHNFESGASRRFDPRVDKPRSTSSGHRCGEMVIVDVSASAAAALATRIMSHKGVADA
jgi:hypothetical protein